MRNDERGFSVDALIDKAQYFVRQGNVRRLRVRHPDGRALIDLPLTVGAVVAVALTLLLPMLTAIAALAALVARWRVEIDQGSGPPPRAKSV